MKKVISVILFVTIIAVLSGCAGHGRHIIADALIVGTAVAVGTVAAEAITETAHDRYYGSYYDPGIYAPPFWPTYGFTHWYYQPGYVVFIGRDGRHHRHHYNSQYRSHRRSSQQRHHHW